MIFAGIDYSITSPAMAVCDNGNWHIIAWTGKKHVLWSDRKFTIECVPYPQHACEIERLSELASAIYNRALRYNVECLFIEGYSFGANGKVFNIAEGCGIMKHLFWADGIVAQDITPGTVKKFATGSGAAKKPEMVEAFIAQTGVDLYDIFDKKRGLKTIPSPITDLADAYFVATTGASLIPAPVA